MQLVYVFARVWMQVKGLEFNPHTPNLLGTGAADHDLCIWDLAKPNAPTMFPALKVCSIVSVTACFALRTHAALLPGLWVAYDMCDALPGGCVAYGCMAQGTSATGGVGEVQHLSWNRKVQHILAACLSNGTTVVWDLKRQKPVISFRDPNRRVGSHGLQEGRGGVAVHALC
jgi:protein transport protein SEC31